MKLFAGMVLLVSAVHVAVVHTFATTGSSSSGLDILKDVTTDAGLESLTSCSGAGLSTGKTGISRWCSCCCGTCSGSCTNANCMLNAYLANCDCAPRDDGVPMSAPGWNMFEDTFLAGTSLAIYGATNSVGNNWKTIANHFYSYGSSNTVMECKNLCAADESCVAFNEWYAPPWFSASDPPYCRFFTSDSTLVGDSSVSGVRLYAKDSYNVFTNYQGTTDIDISTGWQ